MPATLTPPAVPTIASTPGTAVAPLGVSFSGFYGAVSDADDSDLALARTAGISDLELGIGAGATLPAANEAVTPAVAAQTLVDGGAAGAGGPPAVPAAATTPATEVAAPGETKELRIERLKRELAEAEGAEGGGQKLEVGGTLAITLPPLAGPLPGQPLAVVSGDANFTFLADAARRAKSWAFANRDGGDMPAEIASLLERSEALITGRQPAEVTQPKYFDAARTAQLHELSEAMLTEHLPARQRALSLESHWLGTIRKESPAMLDVKTLEGQMFYRVAQSYPALRQYPDWPMLVRHIASDYIRGQKSEVGGQQQATPTAGVTAATEVAAPRAATAAIVPATVAGVNGGAAVPLAPAGSIGGGASLGGVPLSQARIDQAEQRMNEGTATDEDWLVLSAGAV